MARRGAVRLANATAAERASSPSTTIFWCYTNTEASGSNGLPVLTDAFNVLNSPEVVKMSVHIVRAFVKQGELIAGQAEILKKLAQMDAKLLKHDDVLRVIWQELQPLLAPPPETPKKELGFHVREKPASYRAKSTGKTKT